MELTPLVERFRRRCGLFPAGRLECWNSKEDVLTAADTEPVGIAYISPGCVTLLRLRQPWVDSGGVCLHRHPGQAGIDGLKDRMGVDNRLHGRLPSHVRTGRFYPWGLNHCPIKTLAFIIHFSFTPLHFPPIPLNRKRITISCSCRLHT